MHPVQEQLRGFALGTLAEVEAGSIIEHVATCQVCEETLNELEAAPDDFVHDLKRPVSAAAFEHESGCRDLLDRVRNIARPTFVDAPHEATSEGSTSLGELGQYKLLAKLGEGGMGAVYKALHTRLRRVVALKVLPAERMKNQAAVARFDREMQAVGKLNHPNIVAAHDAGEVDGMHYLVMELVEGIDLARLGSRLGLLDAADACELIRQAAVGLAHAQRRGLVHRDIKPSNLMLAQTDEGQPVVKVLDLGLALLAGPHATGKGELTSTGQMMGTLDYMSPEQGADTHNVDIRSDIYSLGATLHKLLCGEPPFCGPKYNTPGKMLVALATETPPSIGEKRRELPAGLAAVVDRMLARRAEDRYALPTDVAEALAPFCAQSNLRALLDAASVDLHEPAPDASEALTPARLSGTQETSPSVPPIVAPTYRLAPMAPLSQSPGSGRMIAIAAVLGGIVLLAAILTIRLSNGSVVVEGPEGGDLPDDVNIVLTGGGKQLEISSAEKWKLSMHPGTYQVDIKGGSDAFEIKDREIRVTRFGQQIVKITRNEGPDKPAMSPPVVSATLKPTPTPNVADVLPGHWKIKEAENLLGESYGGRVQMRVSSTGVVEMDWLDDQGRIVQTGVGLVQDGHLMAAWGVVPSFGFCLYKLLSDGKMEGRWSIANASGRASTETASGGTPGKFEGSYNVQGKPIGSDGQYRGTVSIAKQGETYAVQWTTAEGTYQGIGLRQGDYLAVGWSVPESKGIGVVEYKLQGDTAQGRWTMLGQNRLSFEILEREAEK